MEQGDKKSSEENGWLSKTGKINPDKIIRIRFIFNFRHDNCRCINSIYCPLSFN